MKVGVNAHVEGNDQEPPEILAIGPEYEDKQRARLAQVRAERPAPAVDAALERVRADAADPAVNLMPAVLDAVRAYATVGEIMGSLASVFGRHREQAVF